VAVFKAAGISKILYIDHRETINDSEGGQKRILSVCSERRGHRVQLRSEQQQLRSEDRNGKCSCRDSDVELAITQFSTSYILDHRCWDG
jgi:hypothetical protein